MSLLQLPPEIMMQVMDYVGSSYFHEDLGRLTVCKEWFAFARSACFKDLRLSAKGLRRLMSSRDVEKNLLLVKENLKILDLELNGFDWSFKLASPSRAQHENDVDVLRKWTRALDNDLVQLVTTAKKSPRLRMLRIQAWSEWHPLGLHFPRRNYLSHSTIQALLSVENLTVLELDLCGTFLGPRGDQPENWHVCPTIGALLTTLRRLRLRMRSICADVLRAQQHDTSLRLREVFINLSLDNESRMITSARHSVPCGVLDGGFLKMKADMEHQAEALVARMESPKTIRILTHTLPSFRMRSLDVLTGKSMELANKMAWEDDGEIIEDDPESESEISDWSFTS